MINDDKSLDNETIRAYYDRTEIPTRTDQRHIFKPLKLTKTNVHHIFSNEKKVHIFDKNDYYNNFFNEIVISFGGAYVMSNMTLEVKNNDIEIYNFKNFKQIWMALDHVIIDGELRGFVLPMAGLFDSLKIESNFMINVTIQSRFMSNQETKRLRLRSVEINIKDFAFLDVYVAQKSIDLGEIYYCAVRKMKIAYVEETGILHPKLEPGLNFMSIDHPLYSHFHETKICSSFQFFKFNMYTLECTDKRDVCNSSESVHANQKYLLCGKEKKLSWDSTTMKGKFTLMIQFQNQIMTNGGVSIEKVLSPYIHRHNIGSPLTKVDDVNYIEGYWQQNMPYMEPGDTYPFPIDTNEPNDPIFKSKLCDLIESLIKKKSYDNYLGFSSSRLTGESVGGWEYKFENNGIKWRFPEGIKHYYVDHNVKPSKEFYDMVMSLT
jgi:hypothetical protein